MNAPRKSLMSALIEVTGVTEADVRSVTPEFDRDAYEVRLWNHRRLTVTGLDLVRVYRPPRRGCYRVAEITVTRGDP